MAEQYTARAGSNVTLKLLEGIGARWHGARAEHTLHVDGVIIAAAAAVFADDLDIAALRERNEIGIQNL